MIGIYDREETDIEATFIQNAMGSVEVCDKLSDLRSYNIAIAHVSDEDWEMLINTHSCPSSVRVRVSDGSNFSDKPPRIDENEVYIFHLVPRTGELEAEDWKEILSALSDHEAVEALVKGENQRGLRRFFELEVQEHLSALVLLCEGYLAVHAADSDCHTDVNSALELMRWTEFQRSDGYRALIRKDLGKKIREVQQPQWWLNVFGQESFYDEVKKEWEDTTGEEEIPPALNDLLEAIHSSNSVIPPKIVAAAYCVLGKKIVTTLSEWEIRRSKFNHDWLKGKFLNRFSGFIEQLQKSNPDCVSVSKFLEEDFPVWKSRREDAQWIVQSFEDGMSPRRFLSCSPLNRCANETREWLENLVHELWLFRYSVKEKAKEGQDALIEVNKMYEKLASELEQSMPPGLTKLISLHSQFCELKVKYKVLSKTLSNLLRYT